MEEKNIENIEVNKTSLKIKKEVKTNYFSTGTGPAIDLTMKTFANSETLGLMSKRQRAMTHRTSISAKKRENEVRITQKSQGYQINIQMTNIDTLPYTAKKLFRFLITEICNQSFVYKKDVLKKDTIEFDLQQLMTAGLYEDMDSARRGFKKNMEKLLNLKVEGERTEGKGKALKHYSWVISNVFRTGVINKSRCYVTIEPNLNWNLIISNFELLPNYIYKLSTKTFDLCETIFYMARVNVSSLVSSSKIEISYRTLQQRLGLNALKDNPHPKREQDKIRNAIDELNKIENGVNFTIESHEDSEGSIENWFEKSYITVNFKETLIEEYRKIDEEKSRKIERKQKRIEAKQTKTEK